MNLHDQSKFKIDENMPTELILKSENSEGSIIRNDIPKNLTNFHQILAKNLVLLA